VSVYNFGPLQPAVSNAAVRAAAEAARCGRSRVRDRAMMVTRVGVPVHAAGPLGS
jgi:hypothetical protein